VSRRQRWKNVFCFSLIFISSARVPVGGVPREELDWALSQVLTMMADAQEAQPNVMGGVLFVDLKEGVPEMFPPGLLKVVPEH
jgi:hypothetical protein